MRKALLLNLSIILASTAFTFTGKADRLLDCPALNCSYLPLIGNPPPVFVFEIFQKATRAGTYRFIGDVIATKPVYDVIVEVRFLDKNGNPQKASRQVILKASLPGQLNPFDIYTNVEAYDIIPVEAVAIEWKYENQQEYRNATIVSVSYEEDTVGTFVTAKVRNDGAIPLLDVKGVIWGLYQDYSIEAVNIADRLNPGEGATFSRYLWGTPYSPNIHVSAQGILQP
ncbi:MAG TPA: hypothetical protein VJ436_07200 [Anaerolineales bacterium]|nr:hypothetical protein [Anaerolineales bacterium]